MRKFSSNLILLLAMIMASLPLVAGQVPAVTPPGTKPQTPLLVGETIEFRSRRLDERRLAMIYVPPSPPQSARRFPVIYALDGEFNFLHTVSAATFLAQSGQMPEAIVVGVRNVDRTRDMTPKLTRTSAPPQGVEVYGGADKFLAYIGDELIPYIDAHYPTQPFRVLIGHSLGGLFATYAMVTRPDLFKGYVTMEPSLWWDDRSLSTRVEKFFREHPAYAGRLMMAEGSSTEGWRLELPMLKRSAPAGVHWSLIDVPGEAHETMSFRGRYEALRQLFSDYVPQMRQNESRATLAALEEQYAALSKVYDYQVEIPEAALIEVAQRAIDRKDFASAVVTLERTAVIYPASLRARDLLAQARRLAAAASAVNANESTGEKASAREGAPFIGVWEGTLKTEPGNPTEIVVTFEVAGNALTGYILARGLAANGGDLRSDISAIRVREQTIEWDRLNRGGGRHIHIGTLKDPDTLEGKVELRDGPPPPPGFTLPTVSFILRRRSPPR